MIFLEYMAMSIVVIHELFLIKILLLNIISVPKKQLSLDIVSNIKLYQPQYQKLNM